MSELPITAVELAAKYHADQKDLAGEPYLFHVIRVGLAGRNEAEEVLGYLHDLLEDTDISPSILRHYFSDEIIQALAAITCECGESYSAYIARVSKNPLATAVKIHDLEDNLSRLQFLSQEKADILRDRYVRALDVLRSSDGAKDGRLQFSRCS